MNSPTIDLSNTDRMKASQNNEELKQLLLEQGFTADNWQEIALNAYPTEDIPLLTLVNIMTVHDVMCDMPFQGPLPEPGHPGSDSLFYRRTPEVMAAIEAGTIRNTYALFCFIAATYPEEQAASMLKETAW